MTCSTQNSCMQGMQSNIKCEASTTLNAAHIFHWCIILFNTIPWHICAFILSFHRRSNGAVALETDHEQPFPLVHHCVTGCLPGELIATLVSYVRVCVCAYIVVMKGHTSRLFTAMGRLTTGIHSEKYVVRR